MGDPSKLKLHFIDNFILRLSFKILQAELLLEATYFKILQAEVLLEAKYFKILQTEVLLEAKYFRLKYYWKQNTSNLIDETKENEGGKIIFTVT